jgi:hypothetical protein
MPNRNLNQASTTDREPDLPFPVFIELVESGVVDKRKLQLAASFYGVTERALLRSSHSRGSTIEEFAADLEDFYIHNVH